MILSHSHKFIFIKSRKTAGTSLEAALSNCCKGRDVVTPLGDFEFNRDETGRWIHRAMNEGDFHQHDTAATIRAKVGDHFWNEYFKFSVTRNPWDRVVSLFNWRTRNDPDRRQGKGVGHAVGLPQISLDELRAKFAAYVKGDWETNDAFYLRRDDLCVDFVLRYEQLAEDVLAVCRRVGIAPIELPRLKVGFRPGQYHYSQYYTDSTKALVAEKHRNDIRLFGYRFASNN